MTDGNLLKYFLARKKMNIKDLAEKLNLNASTLSLKLNGHRDFTISEVREIAKILSLSKQNVWDIFFIPKSA